MANTGESPNDIGGSQQPGQVIGPGQPEKKPVVAPETPQEQTKSTPHAPSQAAQASGGVSWSASEFVAHEKSAGWYGLLLIIAVVITAAIYFITRDKISSAMVLVCALVLAIIASRKPRQLQYTIDNGGITIGKKHYDYSAFKSFAVVPEGAFSSIVFSPLKRFSPLITIYYAPEDEDKILNLLTDRLPFEEHKLDAVDNIMRRIRF